MESQTVAQSTSKDVYAMINDRIIEQLNKGTIPWQVPWAQAGIPKNLISGRPYRGINVMLLALMGYEQNLFLTFKQVKEAGGKVLKGEYGHPVVYWNYVEKELKEDSQEKKKIPFLRYYRVFNISQCENLPTHLLPSPFEEKEPLAACEKIIAGMHNQPVIQNKEQCAWYNPVTDTVNIPRRKTFKNADSYYSTLFHELVHSTGHIKRLNRKDIMQMSEFGAEAYSHEELVAEIGTCYLQSFSGITSEFEQSSAYIQGWLTKLQNDKRFIFSASTQAQKAVDYILNIHPETLEDEGEQGDHKEAAK